MAIEATFSSDDKSLTIQIIGVFGFLEHAEFMATYTNKDIRNCTIDMKAALYIDSAALGMLLLLRDALTEDAVVSIVRCNAQVKKTLLNSRFDRKFKIE